MRDLGLNDERVAAAAGFLEAYAETAAQELDELIPRADGPSLAEDPAFTVAADAASAFREAAQWMLYLDPVHAAELLARAGAIFFRMGMPYGMYLMVVAGESTENPPFTAFARAINDLRPADDGDEPGRPDDAFPFIQYPQQQAYLLLASGGSRLIGTEFRRPLLTILESSPHRDGTIATGALGTPIRRLWDIARHLVIAGDDAPDQIRRHLAAMCERYAENMDLAQSNEFLWRGAAAPVDVGDLDLTGIAALTARRLGVGTLESTIGQLQESDLGRVALAPLRAGLTLVEPQRAEHDGEW